MIYYDPTEARRGTRLCSTVIEAGAALVGLEERTGADLLITTKVVPRGNILIPPGSKLFESGAITDRALLVQRKSSGDLLNSIPNLMKIMARMNEVSGAQKWLAYTGVFVKTRSGMVGLDGRETGWGWNAFVGALDAWQIAGGHIHWEESDVDLGEWIRRMDDKIAKLVEKGERFFPADPPKLSHPEIDPNPWRVVLQCFPGLGSTKAMQISDLCGTLAQALWWLSEPNETIEGIGEKTKENWRSFLGLKEGEVLAPVRMDEATRLLHEILDPEIEMEEAVERARRIGKLENLKGILDE